MFSYRHAFHAGNHADVLKHTVLAHMFRYFAEKEKAFWFIDTHAGAGGYELHGEHARRSGESKTGIVRLWDRNDLPDALDSYRQQVKQFNIAQGKGEALRVYPGSPCLAMQMMRRQDRIRLFEMHSTDSRELLKTVSGKAPRVLVEANDGFNGMQTLLPPPSRRGIVLIDPSYENKSDYSRVIYAVRGGIERFATGTFMVWYPLVGRREADQFPGRLKRIQPKDWLHATLTIKAGNDDGLGLNGSGIFLINPPWTLPGMLAKVLPYLVKHLGQDREAAFSMEDTLR